MGNENRRGYEFTPKIKAEVIKEAGGKSVTGKTGKIEIHHIFPVAEARRLHISPAVVRQKSAAVPVEHSEHVQITREIKRWTPEQKNTYFSAIAAWLMELLK